MKIASLIAGALLGLLFVAAGVVVLFNLAPPPPPFPEGSAAAHFMTAFGTTGYLKFVKWFEVIGGVLVAIPRTRRAGLLVLGPILINILAFHGFMTGVRDLFSPMLLFIVALTLFLVWVERAAFCAFLCARSSSSPASTNSATP
jgi:putative oxidoreductase